MINVVGSCYFLTLLGPYHENLDFCFPLIVDINYLPSYLNIPMRLLDSSYVVTFRLTVFRDEILRIKNMFCYIICARGRNIYTYHKLPYLNILL